MGLVKYHRNKPTQIKSTETWQRSKVNSMKTGEPFQHMVVEQPSVRMPENH